VDAFLIPDDFRERVVSVSPRFDCIRRSGKISNRVRWHHAFGKSWPSPYLLAR